MCAVAVIACIIPLFRLALQRLQVVDAWSSENAILRHYTQGKGIRSKACFDMQPTNPRVDIIPTGHYEVWISTVDLVRLKDDIAQNRSSLINATHKASLPKVYEARAACIHKPDGKCIGMMTPERFHLLWERFHEAQKNGLQRYGLVFFCLMSSLWNCRSASRPPSTPQNP